MSTTTKTEPVKTTAQPAAAARTMGKGRTADIPAQDFLFDRSNYTWMIGGIVLILIGFALMAGGKSPDPHKFLPDEIFSFRRITLAPIVCLIGFGVEVYAIMKKHREA